MSSLKYIDAVALERVYGITLGISGDVPRNVFMQVAMAKYDLSFEQDLRRPEPGKISLDAATKFMCHSLTHYARDVLESADTPTVLELIWDAIPRNVAAVCKVSGIAPSIEDSVWTLAIAISKLSAERLEQIQRDSFAVFGKVRAEEIANGSDANQFGQGSLVAYLTELISQLLPDHMTIEFEILKYDKDEGDKDEGDKDEGDKDEGDKNEGDKNEAGQDIDVVLSGDDSEDDTDTGNGSSGGEPYDFDAISRSGLEEIFVTSIIRNDTSAKRKNDPDTVVFFAHEDGEFTEVARCGEKSVATTGLRVLTNFFSSDDGIRFQTEACINAFPNLRERILMFGNLGKPAGRLLIMYFVAILGIVPVGILPRGGAAAVDTGNDVQVSIEKIVSIFTTPANNDIVREKIGGLLARDENFGEILKTIEEYVTASAASPKKRGRPKKNPDPPATAEEKPVSPIPAENQPRKRGRPKKNPDPPATAEEKLVSPIPVENQPRKRGRPKKNPDPPASPEKKAQIPARITRTVAMDNDAAKTLTEMHEPVSTPVEYDGVFISHAGKGQVIDRDLFVEIFTIAEKFRGMSGSDIIHKDAVTIEFLHLLRIMVGAVVGEDGTPISDSQLMGYFVGEYLSKTSEEVLTEAKRAFRQSFGNSITDFSSQ